MNDKPHLLLVDDERSIREPLAQYLSRNGFRVTAVESAAEARTRLAANTIDLVVLDIMMPGEDGLSLCRHIPEHGDFPVILLTATSEETDRTDGLVLREPVAQDLSRDGLRGTAVESADEARTRLAANTIDVVVLDIMRPGEDGLSLCRHSREHGDLPVILLTAKSEERDRIVGLEMGADDCVLKPFSPRE